MKFLKNSLFLTLIILFLVSVAFAQTQVPGQIPPRPTGFMIFQKMIPMFVMVFFIFYFMVLRPQEKKIKAQETLLNSLRKGRMIVTSSGIIGRVAGIEKGYILIEVSNNVRIKVERSHIVKNYEKTSDKTNKQS